MLAPRRSIIYIDFLSFDTGTFMRLLTISLLCASNLVLASSQIVDSRLNSDSNISNITSSASGKGAYASANLGTAVAYATIGSVHEIRANSLSWGGAVGYNTSK